MGSWKQDWAEGEDDTLCSCCNLELWGRDHPLSSRTLRPGHRAPGTGVTLTWAEGTSKEALSSERSAGNTPGNWEMSILVLKGKPQLSLQHPLKDFRAQ